jgi:hypothetical protein
MEEEEEVADLMKSAPHGARCSGIMKLKGLIKNKKCYRDLPPLKRLIHQKPNLFSDEPSRPPNLRGRDLSRSVQCDQCGFVPCRGWGNPTCAHCGLGDMMVEACFPDVVNAQTVSSPSTPTNGAPLSRANSRQRTQSGSQPEIARSKTGPSEPTGSALLLPAATAKPIPADFADLPVLDRIIRARKDDGLSQGTVRRSKSATRDNSGTLGSARASEPVAFA